MKHETFSKPIPISLSIDSNATTTPKRSLWRARSSSEAPPSSMPRSPITKAFDFLPWSRHRKEAAEKTRAAAITAGSPTPCSASGNSAAHTGDEYRKHCIPYHRNILRNGGGLIRDILGDKLNKDKPSSAGGSTLPSPHKKCNQRRPKQVVARNKSLDIKELITCVENELAAEKEGNGRNRFLDDTFIEKIIRAKNEYLRGGAEEEDDGDSNCLCGGEEGCECEKEAPNAYARDEKLHGGNINCSNSNNNNNTTVPSPSKHILFNDENVVYLIKKELPVKREVSKTKAALEHPSNTRMSQQKTAKMLTNYEKERKAESNANVLKARLKFKKLPAPETKSAAEQRNQIMNNQQQQQQRLQPQQQQHGNHYGNQQSSKSDIDNCTILDLDHRLEWKSGNTGKRGILQRQNTSPAAPSRYHSKDGSCDFDRHQHQQHQRKEQQDSTPRRKSLTETSYSLTGAAQNNGSCSSMDSGEGRGEMGGAGIISDRPKTDKPRKKLSFREPVVSERTKSRRLSIPLNHTQSTSSSPVMNGGRDGDSSRLGVDQNGGASKADFVADRSNNDDESQAMRIVRTIGQAFEVCHKFNLHKNSVDNNDERSDVSSDLLDVERISESQLSEDDIAKKDQISVTPELNPPLRPNHLELAPQTNLSARKSPLVPSDDDKSPTSPSSPNREISKLKEQLEQQALQTRQALAQLMLVREQLISETNARIEAQARTQQLLQQNRELLEHLASLGAYTEQQAPGLTTANIAMAPQSQLQMLLQATSNTNNLATISQRINSLGSINQQLTSLSHQLSGLNQQSQNLQNLQNLSATLQRHHQQQQQQQQQQSLTPPIPSTSLQQPQMHLNVSAANASCSTGNLSSSPFPSMNQLQNISSQLQSMSVQNTQQQQQQQQDALSNDLFQVNQELLNRLQVLNLGSGHAATTSTAFALNGSPLPATQQTASPHPSFFYVNPLSCSPSNNNNSASNFNFLSSPSNLVGGSTLNSLTPSPMGTLNRHSYSRSPIYDDLGLSIDRSLNNLDERSLQKPCSSPLCSTASNGNIASAATTNSTSTRDSNSRSSSTLESPTSSTARSGHGNGNGHGSGNGNGNGNGNEARFNTVMLKVTDEAGNVTNQRKLSATPSFITRSTSEKVPNRSQMMSQVQRTAWARHTTK